MRTGLRTIRRAMTPPAARGALVLLYHRAATLDADPWRLAVTPGHLDEHLDVLRRWTRPMRVLELARALEDRRTPPGGVVITFDDGYADLATEVLPRLRRTGLPATMFLVSGAVGSDREFWWDSLTRAILESADPGRPLRLRVAGRSMTWSVAGAADRRAVHRAVWAALRARPPAERDVLVEAVLEWAGQPVTARPTHRRLGTDELADLAADPLVEIGSHTRSHPWLPALDTTSLEDEIRGGLVELETRVGRRVTTFAYPHGSPADIGSAASATVRRAGFRTAFRATPGLARPGADPIELPRLFVEDMDGDQFARLLWRHAGIRAS